mmetsp:Transcript_32703/g.28971  ORF Transcript_32703/g.28971 Transcript_32703/m.28971 type:complete len:477 (-) Transcript_32703:66-1496(-)
MLVISLGMFQFGYGIAFFGSFFGVLHSQYTKNSDPVISSEDDFNSIVITAIPIGAAIGAFTGGIFANLGRRNAIFIANAIICIGAAITMIFNFYALIGGRIILGFGMGLFTVLTPLFISETSPIEMAGTLGSLSQFMVTVGIMIAYLFGFLVPIRYLKDEGETPNPEIYTTQVWRIVFIIPAAISVIQSILLLLIFRFDTPKFYRQNGNESMAAKVEELIYTSKPIEESEDEQMIEKEDEVEQKVSLSQLLTPKYRIALIIGCFTAFFQQMTGINVVIFYSNTVFTKGQDPGYDTEVTARTGTLIVGVVNWAATMVAIPLLSRLGRKTLMLFGQIMMGISLIILAVFSIINFSTGTIIFTLVFVAFFEIGIGSVLWLYLAEIMTEGGMSLASVLVWILTIIVGLFTPRMFDLLTPKGMYFLFAAIDIAGLLFIFIFIKETKGKSKSQLKTLYSGEVQYTKLGEQVNDLSVATSNDV